MSGTERRVWYRLRRRALDGHKFRRQVPIGPYFVDFVCLRSRLVIEIDGAGHDDAERDHRKTTYLESQGFRVMRVPAPDTDRELDEVIDGIYWRLQEPASPP